MGDKKDSKELETISFRGIKDKWIDFTYIAKKKGHKNAWSALEPLINEFIRSKK
ncbi:hypothetical protein JXM83_01210 [Candidatus Woesearchaeota archaeon]|nr:hypothetical protein [Candidatus Woesearchaeota archaeon]